MPFIYQQAAYSDKLRDPLWQRRRLEIILRDNYECQHCLSGDNLQVHHKYYEAGREPWDYPDHALVTLCDVCHETEHDRKPERLAVAGTGFRHIASILFELISNLGTAHG